MSDEEQDELYTQNSPNVELAGNVLVRHILAQCESQAGSTVFNRQKLQRKLKEIFDEEKITPVSFSEVYDYVDAKLGTTFGYHLYGLAAKTAVSKRPASASQRTPEDNSDDSDSQDLKARGQSFVLVRSSTAPVPPRYRQFIMDHSAQMYHRKLDGDTYVGSDYSKNFNRTLDNEVGNDVELATKGVLAVTLCIVILSKNAILESELLLHYEKFGIRSDTNRIPIVGLSPHELIARFVRNGYLHRTVQNPSGSVEELVIYSIGRRTLVEFPKESLIDMCQQILDLDESHLEALQSTVHLLSGDTYKDV